MSSDHQNQAIGSNAANSAAEADPQEHLRRLDRLANLGLIAASAAHEIKNGLVAINTFVEMLLEKGEDAEMAGVVRSELKRIDGLVTQLLHLAAPQPVARGIVNVHELLDYSLRLLEPQMRGSLIVIKRDYRAVPCAIHGNESQLQQVMMNLLLNAIEAMEGAGGELAILTEIGPGQSGPLRLNIHICDTGMGIAGEDLSRVFEVFFTTKKDGIGLGLAICRRVAQDHQGELEVRSVAGRGSTFTLSLPVV